MSARVPAIILGGTGYVAGELLRLTLAHPRLELAAIASDSQPGEPVAKAFPHLAAACGDLGTCPSRTRPRSPPARPRSAVLAAAPHGVSHALIDGLLDGRRGRRARSPRSSTSRRITALPTWRSTSASISMPTARPRAAKDFSCAVPEHLDRAPTPHVAHPGCFVTASLLAAVPLL